MLACAALCCPVLSCAVLCWPVMAYAGLASCAALCCPVLPCAVLWWPMLSCDALCCPMLASPGGHWLSIHIPRQGYKGRARGQGLSCIQLSNRQCSAMQCSVLHCILVQWSAAQCSVVQCSAVQYYIVPTILGCMEGNHYLFHIVVAIQINPALCMKYVMDSFSSKFTSLFWMDQLYKKMSCI